MPRSADGMRESADDMRKRADDVRNSADHMRHYAVGLRSRVDDMRNRLAANTVVLITYNTPFRQRNLTRILGVSSYFTNIRA